jgi:molybdopterin-guanine dinucleotide biosynthesis protein A
MTTVNFNAYILAGGSSRRMGVDKLFLQIEGRSMLERAIATCKSCFRRVKLAAGQADRLSSLDCEVIIDSTKAKGPMAGIIAALEDCRTNSCFVTAADLPDLSAEMIESLVSQYRGQQYFGFIEANNIQPLCGIYHVSSLEVFYRFAQNNDFRMTEAVEALNYGGIDLPECRWRNINRPQDLPDGASNV